jgi:hypothetical protein
MALIDLGKQFGRQEHTLLRQLQGHVLADTLIAQSYLALWSLLLPGAKGRPDLRLVAHAGGCRHSLSSGFVHFSELRVRTGHPALPRPPQNGC